MDKLYLRLKELRIERGYTQAQLATAVQTTDDSIYSWEKGRSQPSIETLIKIADFFECSIDYLVGREDDFGAISINGKPAELSQREKEVLKQFNALPREYQAQVAEYLKYFYERTRNLPR